MEAVAPKRVSRDALDEKLDVWEREIPDIDRTTEGIIERIQILAWNLNQSMEETLARTGLDRRTFSLLGKLRAYGPPYRTSAGKLAGDLMLSSGAMTARLDRLETAGLIRRLPDPNDRRGTLIEPTQLGIAMWDKAVGTQARRERMLSQVLTKAERERLHDLLRTLMTGFPDWKEKKQAAHAAADAAAAEDES